MSVQIAALRKLLEQRFPDAIPPAHRISEQVATGIPRLDAILPGGGLPWGRLATWASGGGATAVLSAACRAVTGRGERAVWIDGAGTVAGACWMAGAYLVRPDGEQSALRCAEELLRSGGFGLVVLSSARPTDTEGIRLSRAVREGGGAFVILGRNYPTAALRVVSCITPGGYRWRADAFGGMAAVDAVTIQVSTNALGWSKQTEISLPVAQHVLCLPVEPRLADRRGART